MMLVFVVCELIAFVVCDPFDGGLHTCFILFDLILTVLLLAMPFLQWYATVALLGNSLSVALRNDEFTFVQHHLTFSIAGVVPLFICIWLWKSVVDYYLLFYLGAEALFFLVVLWKSIRRRRFGALPIYLLCFVFFALPFFLSAITVAGLVAPMLFVIGALLTPASGSVSSDKTEIELQDAFGRHADTIGSSGHSIEGGGSYNQNPNGTWSKH